MSSLLWDNSSSVFNVTAKESLDAIDANSSQALHISPIISSVTPLQIFSALIFAITSLISLLAYILVLVVLFAYFKEFKSNFYFLVISLSLVDMIFLVMALLYIVPCIVLQRDILHSSQIPGALYSFCFISNSAHLTYIGTVRLISVSVPIGSSTSVEKRLNNKYLVISVSVIIWILSTMPNVANHVWRGCDLHLIPNNMAFSLLCDSTRPYHLRDHIALGSLIVSWLLPCAVALTHLLTWIVLYARGVGSSSEIVQRRKRERKLMVQFTLISSATLLYDTSFWFVPKLLVNHPDCFVLITMCGILSASVNPFTYLLFNKLMKAKAKKLIDKMLRRNNGVQPVPMGAVGIQRAKEAPIGNKLVT